MSQISNRNPRHNFEVTFDHDFLVEKLPEAHFQEVARGFNKRKFRKTLPPVSWQKMVFFAEVEVSVKHTDETRIPFYLGTSLQEMEDSLEQLDACIRKLSEVTDPSPYITTGLLKVRHQRIGGIASFRNFELPEEFLAHILEEYREECAALLADRVKALQDRHARGIEEVSNMKERARQQKEAEIKRRAMHLPHDLADLHRIPRKAAVLLGDISKKINNSNLSPEEKEEINNMFFRMLEDSRHWERAVHEAKREVIMDMGLQPGPAGTLLHPLYPFARGFMGPRR